MNERDFLIHHGIKGQKWGVRRFQNKDGSLTWSGKKRYQDLSNKTEAEMQQEIRRKNLESRYYNAMSRSQTSQNALRLAGTVFRTASSGLQFGGNVAGASGAKPQQLALARTGKIGSQAANIGEKVTDIWSRSGKFKNKDLSKFTDEELDKMVKRAEIERTYIDKVKNKNLNDSIETVNNVLGTVGSVVGIAAAGLTIYNMVNQMKP